MATEGGLQMPELVRSITEKLQGGVYECVVCTETIGLRDRLWSCSTCFGVFHLPCIVYWCKSQMQQQRQEAQHQRGSAADVAQGVVTQAESFRCPLCQTKSNTSTTSEYRCYCGKLRDPPSDPSLVLGSCGQQCDKRRADEQCRHTCVLQCHPGPCPPCALQRTQECYCGADEKVVGCSSGIDGYSCGNVCGKELNCGRHYCEQICHQGPCRPCAERVEVTCHCGGTSTDRMCDRDLSYSCSRPCAKKKDCGVHDCDQQCHPGPCSLCLRLPSRQSSCPCGQTPLWKIYYEQPNLVPRHSCEDPVPTCGNVCSIPLRCGMHLCPMQCHDSPCLPCGEDDMLQCCCGSTTKKVPCFVQYLPQAQWQSACHALGLNEKQLAIKAFPLRCQKRCKKPLSCGRHQCDEVCCGNEDHTCYKVCHKKAPCGIHECGRLCHRGMCPPCHNSSFERLYCRCRRTYIEPPVPCGTLPPNCLHPCVVPRTCGHPPNHPCHIEEACPECVVPTQKYCASHNTKMPFLQPCSLKHVSCGRTCGRPLPCCGKFCEKVCHAGPCTHNCPHSFPTLGSPTVDVVRRPMPHAWARKQ